MLACGVGSFIGGFLGGKLCDILRIKNVAFLSVILYSLSCVLLWIASLIHALSFSLISSFVFGFQFFFIEGCLLVVCSRLFNGVPESFAIVKQFHCFSFVIYEIVAMTTSNEI